MRESLFVKQNSGKWSEIEKELQSGSNDPRLLRSQMVDVTDDLSFARTFYPNRSVRVYLNSLARRIHGRIGKTRIRVLPGISEFYTQTVPSIVYAGRKELLVSFLVLLFSVIIGAFSSHHDENFARSILGDDYVEMTLENIQNGAPLGVYGSMDQIEMFIAIATNNLRVSLLVFLCGLLASVGALVMMFRNGVMLGTFMYFFYSRNLEGVFNLTVWMHGTMEIFTLVIMTQAGMMLGKGLVSPGTYSRSRAFRIWGRKGAMLFLSGVPFILFAALIESFLTRHTEMPAIFKLMLILISLALMLLYFVWYPISRFRGTSPVLSDVEQVPEHRQHFEPCTIYTNSRILLFSIGLAARNFTLLSGFVLLSPVFYLFLLHHISETNPVANINIAENQSYIQEIFYGGNTGLEHMRHYAAMLFNPEREVLVMPVTGCWIGLLFFGALSVFRKETSLKSSGGLRLLIICLTAGLVLSSMLLLPVARFASLAIFGPVIILSGIFVVYRSGLPIKNSGEFMMFLTGSIKRNIWFMAFLLTGVLASLLFLVSPFYALSRELFEMTVGLNSPVWIKWLKWLNIYILTSLMSALIMLFIFQLSYLAFSLHEAATAFGLRKKTEGLGSVSKIYGYESE